MSMLNNKNAVTFFVFLLLLIILVNTNYVNQIHNTIIGRCLFVFFIILVTMHNMFLGLLAVLAIIIASNKSFIEGMNNPVTIGDDSSYGNLGKITVITNDREYSFIAKDKKISALKKNKKKSKVECNGVDRESLKECLKAKNSNHLPISKNMFKTTDDVAPSESVKEGFSGGCAGTCPIVP